MNKTGVRRTFYDVNYMYCARLDFRRSPGGWKSSLAPGRGGGVLAGWKSSLAPGRGGGTPYTGRLPERGTFFRLQVYKRVRISQVEVYKMVGKSVI